MIFYVDADNKYKSRIEGIRYLTSKDTVIIYYNGNNSIFSEKTIEELKERFNCSCNLKIKRMQNIPQSVDFGIAIDAAADCANDSIYIIGEDKHLESIAKVIDRSNVGYAITIKDCLLERLCEIDDISDFVEFVEKFFPRDKASKFIRNQIKMSTQLNKCATEIYRLRENN